MPPRLIPPTALARQPEDAAASPADRRLEASVGAGGFSGTIAAHTLGSDVTEDSSKAAAGNYSAGSLRIDWFFI